MMLVASSENIGLCPMSFTDSSHNMIFERLQYQRTTGRFCDAELLVHSKTFAAHRNILAAHSPYFDSMFKECKITKEQITINSKYPAVFELCLNYMYSGNVVIDRGSVSELLRFANDLMIIKLKNYCAEYLDRYLDAANCLSIRSLAQRYNLPALIKSATDYFDSNLNRCLLDSKDIMGYTYTQLTRLLSDPKYSDCITPDTYLKLIVRWVGEEMAKREEIFRLLLESCEFRQVAADTLEFLLDYSPLLSKSQKSRFLLLHVMDENQMLMEKYTAQLQNLRQKLVDLPVLHDPSQFFEDDLYDSTDSENDDPDDYIVEGHMTSAQMLESGNDLRKMKQAFGGAGGAGDKKKLRRPKGMKRMLQPLNPLPTSNTENESIPWIDEDGIDGVYATSSLEGCHTYGPIDMMDPDDCEDEEDQPDENGPSMCHFCGYRTSTEEFLEKHKARYHNRNTYYMCHLCEFETNWSKQFYLHCQEHWGERGYRCDRCGFQTDQMQEWLTHRLQHTDERYFKCGECAWKGRTRSQLFAHERMHSVLDDRPLHCEECGRGFQQHASLEHHIATHNDVRPFICEDCGFATKTADHLSLHRRQHTDDNFSCHIAGCDYSSTKKSQLAAHLRTHMAVRAHLCKICGRGFIEKSHLVRHERIHLEEKPFKCEQCEYASSRRDKLKEHIIKHHNEGTVTVQKTYRRKYKRQRMLAAADEMINNPDVLFRPIQEDSVSTWQANNDFSAYSPQPDYGNQSTIVYGNPNPSPPRAYSVVHPSQHPQHVPSPGCMSMMNMPLGDNHHQMQRVDSPGSIATVDNTHGALMTPNLVMRSPHNRSAVQSQYNMPSTSDQHQQQHLHNRPFSLPTYGQMDMAQVQLQQQQQMHHGMGQMNQMAQQQQMSQQQQQQSQQNPDDTWNSWNMQ